MIKGISPDFKAQFTQLDSGERFYFDPRNIDYPPVLGTPVYQAITTARNMPGSSLLTSSLTYMFSPSSSFTIDVLLAPNHASGTASNIIRLLGGDALTLAYSTSGYYTLTDRSSHVATGGVYGYPFKRLTMVFTFGGTMYLYYNGTLANSASAAALALNDVMLEINGSGNSLIKHVRIFNGYAATSADVADNFKDVKYEEIYFGFNKNAIGRTRCNITDYAFSYNYSRSKGYKPGTASISVHNVNGEFSADQYATFSPQNGLYNGLVTQKYLTREMRIELEVWAKNTNALYPSTTLYPSTILYPRAYEYYEPIFLGYVKPGTFLRSTDPGGISNITISASDGLSKIKSRVIRTARAWEDYELSSSDGVESLFHEIAKLGTYRDVYNYCGNSCFENTTISNSWYTNGTFTRTTTKPLSGTYCGEFSGTDKYFYQTVVFPNLSSGEKFTASIYCYATSAITGTLILSDLLGSTINSTTTTAFTHSGKGWDKLIVTHTIGDSDSDRLGIAVSLTGTVSGICFDCAMLKYGDDIPYIFANNNDGTSGVMAVGSEQNGAYEFIGIDADDVTYIHPWGIVKPGENCGNILGQLCDACLARCLYIDAAGVLVMKSPFDTPLGTTQGDYYKASILATGTQDLTANKVKDEGVHVEKKGGDECVWQMTASGLTNDDDSGSQWLRILVASEAIPSTTYDGCTELECVYTQSS